MDRFRRWPAGRWKYSETDTPSILTHFSHPVHLINPVIRYHVRPPLDPQAPIKLARQAVTLTLRTGLLPRVFVVAGNPLAAILKFPSLVVCKLAVIESPSAGCWSLPVVGLCDRSNSRILSGEKITYIRWRTCGLKRSRRQRLTMTRASNIHPISGIRASRWNQLYGKSACRDWVP